MKLRSRGSELCRNRGKTSSALPSLTRATAAAGLTHGQSSLISSLTHRAMPDRGGHERPLGPGPRHRKGDEAVALGDEFPAIPQLSRPDRARRFWTASKLKSLVPDSSDSDGRGDRPS